MAELSEAVDGYLRAELGANLAVEISSMFLKAPEISWLSWLSRNIGRTLD